MSPFVCVYVCVCFVCTCLCACSKCSCFTKRHDGTEGEES